MRATRTLAAAIAVLFLTENVVLVSATETNFWSERRRVQVAQAPVDAAPVQPSSVKSVYSALPDVHRAFQNSIPHGVPEWVQAAIAGHASIHDIRLSDSPSAKTVFLIQDAHLHNEAQSNIADTLESLAQAAQEKGSRLVVGMEGARAGLVDLSRYDALRINPGLLGDIVRGLTNAHVLNGTEMAAIRSGRFDLAGVEEISEYNANVQALRDLVPSKPAAKEALETIRRAVVEAKNGHFDATLMAFDAKNTAYNDGKLGLPEYAVYLDSIVPADGANTRLLIQASLLEADINFDKVERERSRMLNALVPKLSDTESRALIQLSLLFRAGQVTSAAYYDHLKALNASHGIALSNFPELNLYIQYALKTDGINHAALFDEIRVLEDKVRGSLASNKQDREILDLAADVQLLTKLIDQSLTEDEWNHYKTRKKSISNIAERIAAVGVQNVQVSGLIHRIEPFEAFYVHAVNRNDRMSSNLARVLTSSAGPYAALVVGGFHTEGLAQNLQKAGFHVFVMSPTISKVEDGPSSLDVLASGRLPIDQLFVGQRLFLPTPPETAGPSANVLPPLVKGTEEAIEQIEKSGGPAAETKADGVDVQATKSGEAGKSGEGLGFDVERPEGDINVKAKTEQPKPDSDFKSSITGEPFPWIQKALGPLSAAKTIKSLGIMLSLPLIPSEEFSANDSWFAGLGQPRTATMMRGISRNPKDIIRRYPELQNFTDALNQILDFKNGMVTVQITSAAERVLTALMMSELSTRPAIFENLLRKALGVQTLTNDAALNLTQRLANVKRQLGLDSSPITVQLVTGTSLDDYGQVEGNVIKISAQLLHAQTSPARIAAVKRVMKNWTTQQAFDWLADDLLTHELGEGFLRRVNGLGSQADRAIQKQFHDLQVARKIGARGDNDVPTDPAAYSGIQPQRDRLAAFFAELVAVGKRDLLNEQALALIPKPAAAPTAPAVPTSEINVAKTKTIEAPVDFRDVSTDNDGNIFVGSARGSNYYDSKETDPKKQWGIHLLAHSDAGGIDAVAQNGEFVAVAGQLMPASEQSKGMSIYLYGAPSAGKRPGSTPLLKLPIPSNVKVMKFSPKGTRLYTIHDDNQVRVWDLTSPADKEKTRLIKEMKFSNPIWDLEFSDGGKTIGMVTKVGVVTFDSATLETKSRSRFDEKLADRAEKVTSARLAPGLQKVAVVFSDAAGEVSVLRISDFAVLQRFQPAKDEVSSMAFDGTATRMALAYRGNGNPAYAVNVNPSLEPVAASAAAVALGKSNEPANRILFAPDGKSVVFGASGQKSITRATIAAAANFGWPRAIGLSLMFAGLTIWALHHGWFRAVTSDFAAPLLIFLMAVLVPAVVIVFEELTHKVVDDFEARQLALESVTTPEEVMEYASEAFEENLMSRDELRTLRLEVLAAELAGDDAKVKSIGEELVNTYRPSAPFDWFRLRVLTNVGSMRVLWSGQLAGLSAGVIIISLLTLGFHSASLMWFIPLLVASTLFNQEAFTWIRAEIFNENREELPAGTPDISSTSKPVRITAIVGLSGFLIAGILVSLAQPLVILLATVAALAGFYALLSILERVLLFLTSNDIKGVDAQFTWKLQDFGVGPNKEGLFITIVGIYVTAAIGLGIAFGAASGLVIAAVPALLSFSAFTLVRELAKSRTAAEATKPAPTPKPASAAATAPTTINGWTIPAAGTKIPKRVRTAALNKMVGFLRHSAEQIRSRDAIYYRTPQRALIQTALLCLYSDGDDDIASQLIQKLTLREEAPKAEPKKTEEAPDVTINGWELRRDLASSFFRELDQLLANLRDKRAALMAEKTIGFDFERERWMQMALSVLYFKGDKEFATHLAGALREFAPGARFAEKYFISGAQVNQAKPTASSDAFLINGWELRRDLALPKSLRFTSLALLVTHLRSRRSALMAEKVIGYTLTDSRWIKMALSILYFEGDTELATHLANSLAPAVRARTDRTPFLIYQGNLIAPDRRPSPAERTVVTPTATSVLRDATISAFFGNEVGILGVLFDGLLAKVGGDEERAFFAFRRIVLMGFKGQAGKTDYDPGINETLKPMMNALDRLQGGQTVFEEFAKSMIPLFGSVPILIEKFIEAAGFNRVPDESDYVKAYKRILDSVVALFPEAKGAVVDVQIYNSSAEDFVLVTGGAEKGQKRITIRVTSETLNQIAASGAELQRRYFRAGRTISEAAAKSLAIRTMFAHEIARGLLGLNHQELVDIGVADEGTLGRNETGLPDDLLNSRARTIQEVTNAIRARKVLKDLFRDRKILNYDDQSARTILELKPKGFRLANNRAVQREALVNDRLKPTIVDGSVSVLQIDRHLSDYERKNPDARVVPFLTLMTMVELGKKLRDAEGANATAEMRQAAAAIRKRIAEKRLGMATTDKFGGEVYQNRAEGAVNPLAIEFLLDWYARVSKISRADIKNVSILAGRPLSVDRNLLAELTISIVVAVDLTVKIDNQIKTEQLLFTQA